MDRAFLKPQYCMKSRLAYICMWMEKVERLHADKPLPTQSSLCLISSSPDYSKCLKSSYGCLIFEELATFVFQGKKIQQLYHLYKQGKQKALTDLIEEIL